MDEELQFKGGNPGAVKYGNFINYYQFHSIDERISLLPRHIWPSKSPFLALDIGCNSGELTYTLQNFLKSSITDEVYLLGLDIDPFLVERAKENNEDENISFHCVDVMDENKRKSVICNYLQSRNSQHFDAVFCFSTTMWIHLNHGDSGLKSFLNYIFALGEILIIEPQPWKCYKTAVKRMKQKNSTFPYFEELKVRGDIENAIEKYLVEELHLVKIHTSDRTKWGRHLLFFKNPEF